MFKRITIRINQSTNILLSDFLFGLVHKPFVFQRRKYLLDVISCLYFNGLNMFYIFKNILFSKSPKPFYTSYPFSIINSSATYKSSLIYFSPNFSYIPPNLPPDFHGSRWKVSRNAEVCTAQSDSHVSSAGTHLYRMSPAIALLSLYKWPQKP